MFDIAEMFETARLLLGPRDALPVPQARLRRAVSTAYYALFHAILRAGAIRFIGSDKESTPGYSILYRSFTHGRMKAVCETLDVPVLSRNLAAQLRRTAVSDSMRTFAGNFVVLQIARHRADYDPIAEWSPLSALKFVELAEIALAAFGCADPDEQADVLALMLSNPRA